MGKVSYFVMSLLCTVGNVSYYGISFLRTMERVSYFGISITLLRTMEKGIILWHESLLCTMPRENRAVTQIKKTDVDAVNGKWVTGAKIQSLLLVDPPTPFGGPPTPFGGPPTPFVAPPTPFGGPHSFWWTPTPFGGRPDSIKGKGKSRA